MSAFGEAALQAAESSRGGMSPNDAWVKATAKMTKTMREKSCPKSAFLGLCDAGLVKGISKGTSTTSKDNKRYAIEAIALLKNKPGLAHRTNAASRLWKMLAHGKTPNSQMDVVISLWNERLIR
jgi:hypothetical protein